MIRRFSRNLAVHSPSNTVTIPKYRVVVIGAGSGGMAVSAQLASQHSNILTSTASPEYDASICVVDPAAFHYYQPLWTLVGGGLKSFEESRKPMSKVVAPFEQVMNGKLYKHIPQHAALINPTDNQVTLGNGEKIEYDYLVVAPGIECLWDRIPGMKEAVEDPKAGVTSNYHVDAVRRTSSMIKDLTTGNAIFTQPSTPIKCAGAPQKIMYLAEEQWRLGKVRDNINISFYSGMGKLFSVDKYANSLWKICKDRNINVKLTHELIEIDSNNRKAVFKKLDGGDEHVTVPYDFIHVVPHMGPPKFISESGLGNAAGWMEINSKHLQNEKHRNIFGLGDCSSLPVSKTASAVSAQSSVVTTNLIEQMKADMQNQVQPGEATIDATQLKEYSGYTSCPLVTGATSLIMAEFNGFTLEPRETFWFDQSQESMLMSVVKKDVLPILYWDVMMRGNWIGPEPYRNLFNPFDRN